MDKLENWLHSHEEDSQELDTDQLIAATHRKIKRRSRTRKAVYGLSSTSAMVILLLFLLQPGAYDADSISGELFYSDATFSWYDSITEEDATAYEEELYYSTVDYLVDSGDYFDDDGFTLEGEELEAFTRYLEEV